MLLDRRCQNLRIRFGIGTQAPGNADLVILPPAAIGQRITAPGGAATYLT
jgi:hypothetical protein